MSKTRNDIINSAKALLGKPYVWGGESDAEGGYDCSGATYRIFRNAGFNIPRSTAQGYRTLGKKITYAEAKDGDLLFFGASSASHIAIYKENGKMYESIGGSKNTKNNPGKGIVLDSAKRRSDLIEVRTMFDDANTEDAKTSTEPSYAVGSIYTTQVELKVRAGAGTNYSAKKHNQLTVDGMKHDKDGDGALDEGTRVSCLDIAKNGNDIWIKTPSGWLAAYFSGNIYIK